MSDNFNKKAYQPMNIGIAIFIMGVITGWIFNVLGFEKLSISFCGVAILAFFYGMIQLQRLINKSIDDKFKNNRK